MKKRRTTAYRKGISEKKEVNEGRNAIDAFYISSTYEKPSTLINRLHVI